MPQIKSSFALNSKYPLDIRDSFDTLEELKNPGILFDEGHITYCKETGKHYIYDDKYWNNLSGYFKEFVVSGGESIPDDIQSILDNKVDKEEGKGLSTNDFNDSYKLTLDNLDSDLESKYVLKLPFGGIIEEEVHIYKKDIDPSVFERLESNPIYFLKNPIDFRDDSPLKPQFACYDNTMSSYPYTSFDTKYIDYFNKSKLSKYQDIDGNIFNKLFTSNDNIYFHSNDNLLTLNDLNLDNKVDKEEGKGLSTNDFTNDYKSILDDLSSGNQILPEYKENSVLWSNYGKTLEWTDKFNSVDYLGGSDNPISQRAFTYGQNKRIVYQNWYDAFTNNFGDPSMFIIPNGWSMYIMDPLNTEIENPENPEESGVLSEMCICPAPLISVDNPKESLYNIYNHEIIFRTGENIPNVLYGDSMGFELLWEKSTPILEPNKTYKISFDTSIIYNPETFESDSMIAIGRWVELIGGNTTYGLRKPNFKEIFDMIKEKGEVK